MKKIVLGVVCLVALGASIAQADIIAEPKIQKETNVSEPKVVVYVVAGLAAVLVSGGAFVLLERKKRTKK